MSECKVTFYPEGKSVTVERGDDLLHAAVAAGVYINSSCGGDGVCGRCRVIIKKGEVVSDPTGRLSDGERKKGYCLACRTTVKTDVEAEVPPESRLEEEQILTEEAKVSRLAGLYSRAEEIEVIPEREETLFTHSPLATKMYLELPPPTLQDNISDLERLYREIRKNGDIPLMQTGLANVKKLGRLLRESNWRVTVTLGKRNGTVEIVFIEPGDTSRKNYGVAIDVGTTTVVAQLVNLNTRQVLGTKATHNTQASYGEDIISRIIYASEKDGLERLHHAVIDSINSLISNLVQENNLSLNDIIAVMCAGNMTMTHLLLRVDPGYLRREPYVPTANFVPVIRAAETGIKTNPRGLLSCLPGVSSYVGGDITAGTLASGLSDSEEVSLLIDVGTNGEIVLGNKDWLVCCSSSAGPAFEGCGVKCGMRAVKGAIQRVEINSQYEVKYRTIGGAKPRGICGSGFIDTLSELLKAGIIDRSGKMKRDLRTSRLREGEEGLEFILAWEKEAEGDHDIVITEADAANLIRSKGAVYAGAAVLVRSMGLRFEDLGQIYIAGGFGNYLNIEKAILIGLLPDIPRDKIHFIGNSSLRGARQAMLSYEALNKVKEIANKMTYFELSVDPIFMDEYTAALFLPHTDMELFPSVREKLRL
ncbi:ASKHA domain-containing protein [candidate division NPL-UPA2 bacterium]|nr:ASKHA domain-containing protein [candidate division NPL-UPA2 bacterium]